MLVLQILVLLASISSVSAVKGPVPLPCEPDELRVARCQNQESVSEGYNLFVEQMLVCQRPSREFSLRVRYLDSAEKKAKETQAMPAQATSRKDSSVEYTTSLGFSLILSANREQAVIRHCVPVAPLALEGKSSCQDRIALCK